MKKKILIVDDSDDLRKLVVLTLGGVDVEFFEAWDGAGALSLIRDQQPQVLILDVAMPGSVNGYQVCSTVKHSPAGASTTVILLSAGAQQADFAQGRQAQADYYLTKPFSPLQLLELVQRSGVPS